MKKLIIGFAVLVSMVGSAQANSLSRPGEAVPLEQAYGFAAQLGYKGDIYSYRARIVEMLGDRPGGLDSLYAKAVSAGYPGSKDMLIDDYINGLIDMTFNAYCDSRRLPIFMADEAKGFQNSYGTGDTESGAKSRLGEREYTR